MITSFNDCSAAAANLNFRGASSAVGNKVLEESSSSFPKVISCVNRFIFRFIV